LVNDSANDTFNGAINKVAPLENIIIKFQPNLPEEDKVFVKEFVLWALVEYKKLDKKKFEEGYEFEDTILKGY